MFNDIKPYDKSLLPYRYNWKISTLNGDWGILNLCLQKTGSVDLNICPTWISFHRKPSEMEIGRKTYIQIRNSLKKGPKCSERQTTACLVHVRYPVSGWWVNNDHDGLTNFVCTWDQIYPQENTFLYDC